MKKHDIELEIGVWYKPDLVPKDGSWFVYFDDYIDFGYFNSDSNKFFGTDNDEEISIQYWCLLPPVDDNKYWKYKRFLGDLKGNVYSYYFPVVVINEMENNCLWSPYDLAYKDFHRTDYGNVYVWEIDNPKSKGKFSYFYELPKLPE